MLIVFVLLAVATVYLYLQLNGEEKNGEWSTATDF